MSWKNVSVAGLAVFVALSVTDFVQTFALVETSGGRVVEGNPVAAEWLARYGWVGLAAFKAASVLVVAGVVLILARRRPSAGALVAAVGCAALVWVTTYSHSLLADTPHATDELNLIAVHPAPAAETGPPRHFPGHRRLPAFHPHPGIAPVS